MSQAALRRALLASPALLFSSSPAWACSACFGLAQGPMIDGARVAIAFMLVLVVGLQVGFAAFFLHLRREARRAARQAQGEWPRSSADWRRAAELRPRWRTQ
jgi:hypothetical protein